MRVPLTALGRRKASNSLLLLLLLLLAPAASPQSVSLPDTTDITFITGERAEPPRATSVPSGAYVSYGSKVTLDVSDSLSSSSATSAAAASSTSSTAAAKATDASPISGSITPSSATSSPSSTSTPLRNTQPCNGHVELCKRKYGHMTFVGAHNSPFVRAGNSGSNQELPVKTQLDDGVRLVQGQMQWPANGTTPHFCHSTCDLLDAGPITDWLTQVREWVDDHPYDVVTVLLGNGNFSAPEMYAPLIEQSGLVKYAYRAPFLPMALNDWPTLGELLVSGSRVVLFMDYMADQRRYPWLLDQFAHMWETPFDPQDRRFPCDVQRPPQLSPPAARDRLYLANHNLNVQFSIFGAEVLVPAVAVLNDTNAADECRTRWGRAPNFLHVDYYNYGRPRGSVFDVAARANNVTYDGRCCGVRSGASRGSWSLVGLVAGTSAAVLLQLLW